MLTRIRARLARIIPIGRSGVNVAQVAMLRSVTQGVNLCTGLITAAMLGPAGRGEQAALILAPTVLAGLATLGLHASLIYNIKADAEHEREYIAINFVLTFCAGVAAMAIGWFLEPMWLSKYSTGIIDLARVFLLLTPLMTASFTFIAALEARGRFVLANQYAYLQALCTLAILGVLALTKHLTPGTAAGAYAVPCAFSFLYLGAVVVHQTHPRFTLRLNLFVRLLHYGLRFYGVDFLGVTSGYLDQVIIAAILPPSALGIYVVALSLSRVLTVLPSAAETVLFPKLAARPLQTITEAVGVAVRVLSSINAVAAVCLGLLGPHLLTLLYGAKFAAASGPLFILLIATVPANAVGLLYQSYSGSGRPGMVTIIHGIGLAFSFGSMLLLVPVYGTVGAALALLIAALVRLGFVLLGMPLILRVRVPRLIVSRSDFAWMRGR